MKDVLILILLAAVAGVLAAVAAKRSRAAARSFSTGFSTDKSALKRRFINIFSASKNRGTVWIALVLVATLAAGGCFAFTENTSAPDAAFSGASSETSSGATSGEASAPETSADSGAIADSNSGSIASSGSDLSQAPATNLTNTASTDSPAFFEIPSEYLAQDLGGTAPVFLPAASFEIRARTNVNTFCRFCSDGTGYDVTGLYFAVRDHVLRYTLNGTTCANFRGDFGEDKTINSEWKFSFIPFGTPGYQENQILETNCERYNAIVKKDSILLTNEAKTAELYFDLNDCVGTYRRSFAYKRTNNRLWIYTFADRCISSFALSNVNGKYLEYAPQAEMAPEISSGSIILP